MHRRRRGLCRAERATARQATRHAELEAVDARLAACGDSVEAAAFTECALPAAGLCARARRHCAPLTTAVRVRRGTSCTTEAAASATRAGAQVRALRDVRAVHHVRGRAVAAALPGRALRLRE